MKESKKGVWYNGLFCPVWSSLHWNATRDFYRGGLPDIARACKCDDSLAVVVQNFGREAWRNGWKIIEIYGSEDIHDRADMEERGQRAGLP